MMSLLDNIRSYSSRVPWPVWLVAVFVLGFLLRGSGGRDHDHPAGAGGSPGVEDTQARVWTCAMHPQVRQPKPGKCPICFMNLIPASDSGGDESSFGPAQIMLSPAARELAEVEVAPVIRKSISREVRMQGVVGYDETRLTHITAWIAGRLDRLYVDYTGAAVRKGAPLAELFSPELYSAQEELLQSVKGERLFEKSSIESISSTARLTTEAAREKLRLWGLSDSQIQEVIDRGTPSTHITIQARIGGTVVSKDAVQGMYVKTGTRLYTIADLRRIWVLLEAYESDLPWLGVGQQVSFTTESRPGETLRARIAFIDPVIDPGTRTAQVRLEVENPRGNLKPEMLVRAVVQSDRMAGDGTGAPLLIPASAALVTGRRAVVYVELPGGDGIYEGREVALGPRAGDYYLVTGGIAEGEMVVVNGAFKIDSEVQLRAKSSMMSPRAGLTHSGHEREHLTSREIEPYEPSLNFTSGLQQVYDAYFLVQKELAADNFGSAHAGAGRLAKVLEQVDHSSLPPAQRKIWLQLLGKLRPAGAELAAAAELEKIREAFSRFSEHLAAAAGTFSSHGKNPVVLFHCPMAFDNKGAIWLQDHGDTENPYFGAMMLRCQDRVDTLYAGSRPNPQGKGHEHE